MSICFLLVMWMGSLPERARFWEALFWWRGPTLQEATPSPGPETHRCLPPGHSCLWPCTQHHGKSAEQMRAGIQIWVKSLFSLIKNSFVQYFLLCLISLSHWMHFNGFTERHLNAINGLFSRGLFLSAYMNSATMWNIQMQISVYFKHRIIRIKAYSYWIQNTILAQGGWKANLRDGYNSFPYMMMWVEIHLLLFPCVTEDACQDKKKRSNIWLWWWAVALAHSCTVGNPVIVFMSYCADPQRLLLRSKVRLSYIKATVVLIGKQTNK